MKKPLRLKNSGKNPVRSLAALKIGRIKDARYFCPEGQKDRSFEWKVNRHLPGYQDHYC